MEDAGILQGFVNIIYNTLLSIAQIVILPLQLLIDRLFPDFNTAIASVNQFINTYLGAGLTWFFNFFPSSVQNAILFCIDSIAILYTISLTAWTIVKLLSIIHKVKIIG